MSATNHPQSLEDPHPVTPTEIDLMSFSYDIRLKIYEKLLVTPSLPPYVGDQTQGSNGSNFFNVNILAASQQIHDEATPILYGANIFRTLYYDARTFTDLGEYLETGSTMALEEKLEELQQERDTGESSTASNSARDDIAHMFDESSSNMAPWLSDLTFPLFLHAIGPTNTARIQTFQFDLGSLPTARDRLPLYTHLAREHMAGLRTLIVAFANIGDYGDVSKFGSYSYDEHGDDSSNLSWAERETLTQDSLADMLGSLLEVVEHVPSLTRLQVAQGGEFLDVMADVVMEFKRTGSRLLVSLNTVRRRYIRMKAAQAEALLGIPAWQSRQWMARNLTWQKLIPPARESY